MSKAVNNIGVTVVERLVASKNSDAGSCEDALFVCENFAGVIDGVTSKRGYARDGLSAGLYAAGVIKAAVKEIAADATAVEAVTALSEAVVESRNNVEWPETEVIAAAIAMISFFHRQLWIVGDCQALLDERHIRFENRVDRVLSEARALWFALEELNGESFKYSEDPGRQFIMPLLERQKLLHNRRDAAFGFAIINGEPVPQNGINIVDIDPGVENIVLATDGYPVLAATLSASEAELRRILKEDPGMTRLYPSTKGLGDGQDSFDDRAYLRLHWQSNASQDNRNTGNSAQV